MIPFSVKIVFFCLSFTGLLACWIVLWAFGRALRARWVASVYCLGCTLLQGALCLGLIYRMDPFQMPRPFCVAQTIIISFGAFIVTGVALAFSLATSLTVLKPKSWGDNHHTLKWRTVYYGPIIVYPVVASAIHIALVLKLDSIHPSNDLHCDSSSPEWVRFFGYAGSPCIMSLPSLYLSIKSIIRVYKTNRHIQRARSESIDGLTIMPKSSRKPEFQLTGCAVIPSPSPKRSTFPDGRKPAIPAISATPRKFHLPFSAPPDSSGRGDSSSFSLQEIDGDGDDSSSHASISFPTFTRPQATSPVALEDKALAALPPRSEGHKSDTNQGVLAETRTSESVIHGSEWDDSKVQMDYNVSRDEFVVTERCVYSPQSNSMAFPSGLPLRKPQRRPPNLAPAVWRIILFQVAFTSVQFLACISTIIDVATRRTTPTAMGTQHFALLLAAWGPVIVFGHLPAVRRNLIPWRAMT